uniref:Uncharacterized protein n=1 Tax=Anopheles farauti TaxID=69004 RepID=A0A182QIF5_9DIPT
MVKVGFFSYYCWYLVFVVDPGRIIAALNDSATESVLYDGRLKWNDYRYLEGLPLDQLLLLQRKIGTTYYHPSITGTATLASVIKKRKPFMRRKRDLPYQTPLDAYDPDQLYRMMVEFAEGYASHPSGSY